MDAQIRTDYQVVSRTTPIREGDLSNYFVATWRHAFPDDPVTIYTELDDDRLETRKVEVFRDGSVGWADTTAESRSRLSESPVPTVSEIAADPQFSPREIPVEEFEEAWRRAQTATPARTMRRSDDP
jgi:hypothetical protein